MNDLFKSGLWTSILAGHIYEFQNMIFQPVGGMGMIGKAFGKKLGHVIQYNAKVTGIHQDAKGVTATYIRLEKGGAPRQTACRLVHLHDSRIDPRPDSDECRRADAECDRCALLRRGDQDRSAVQAPLLGRGRRRSMAASATRTSRSALIGYPSTGYFKKGPGVLLGAYTFGMNAFRSHGHVAGGSRRKRRSSAAPRSIRNTKPNSSTAWPSAGIACRGRSAARRIGRKNCARSTTTISAQIDGRIVLAGEHASRLPAWQEGAILSSLDAITRLHQRVLAS